MVLFSNIEHQKQNYLQVFYFYLEIYLLLLKFNDSDVIIIIRNLGEERDFVSFEKFEKKIGQIIMTMYEFYRLSIVNLCKEESLYNDGLKPLLYSTEDAKTKAIGWRRCGDNITYYRNNDS